MSVKEKEKEKGKEKKENSLVKQTADVFFLADFGERLGFVIS